MISVGLTGGIATGKSLVSGTFKELGAYIIDADIISRNLVESGKPAYWKIVSLFGYDIVNSDNSLNRAKIAAIVFSDHSFKKKLEEIIHPRVIEEQHRLINQISSEDKGAIIIVDAPLLIESGFYKELELLIVVTASKQKVVERLFDRNSLSQKEAMLRMSAQIPLEEKEKLADYIIDNNGDIDATKARVSEIMTDLKLATKKGENSH